MARWRVGVDSGGTFADVCLFDEEASRVEDVVATPRHPDIAAVFASMPKGDADRLTAIPGNVPQRRAMPAGCRFAPRRDIRTAMTKGQDIAR
jgi:oligopeptide/dipeptide ABC transporter ATP-binding protein